MAGLILWGAFLNHPKIVALSHTQRSILIQIAGAIMDTENEDVDNDFILNETISYMPGDYDEYQTILKELEVMGLVQHFDDPDGWKIPHFHDTAERFRAGTKATSNPLWGQKTFADIHAKKEGNRNRQAKHRQGRKDDSIAYHNSLGNQLSDVL